MSWATDIEDEQLKNFLKHLIKALPKEINNDILEGLLEELENEEIANWDDFKLDLQDGDNYTICRDFFNDQSDNLYKKVKKQLNIFLNPKKLSKKNIISNNNKEKSEKKNNNIENNNEIKETENDLDKTGHEIYPATRFNLNWNKINVTQMNDVKEFIKILQENRRFIPWKFVKPVVAKIEEENVDWDTLVSDFYDEDGYVFDVFVEQPLVDRVKPLITKIITELNCPVLKNLHKNNESKDKHDWVRKQLPNVPDWQYKSLELKDFCFAIDLGMNDLEKHANICTYLQYEIFTLLIDCYDRCNIKLGKYMSPEDYMKKCVAFEKSKKYKNFRCHITKIDEKSEAICKGINIARKKFYGADEDGKICLSDKTEKIFKDIYSLQIYTMAFMKFVGAFTKETFSAKDEENVKKKRNELDPEKKKEYKIAPGFDLNADQYGWKPLRFGSTDKLFNYKLKQCLKMKDPRKLKWEKREYKIEFIINKTEIKDKKKCQVKIDRIYNNEKINYNPPLIDCIKCEVLDHEFNIKNNNNQKNDWISMLNKHINEEDEPDNWMMDKRDYILETFKHKNTIKNEYYTNKGKKDKCVKDNDANKDKYHFGQDYGGYRNNFPLQLDLLIITDEKMKLDYKQLINDKYYIQSYKVPKISTLKTPIDTHITKLWNIFAKMFTIVHMHKKNIDENEYNKHIACCALKRLSRNIEQNNLKNQAIEADLFRKRDDRYILIIDIIKSKNVDILYLFPPNIEYITENNRTDMFKDLVEEREHKAKIDGRVHEINLGNNKDDDNISVDGDEVTKDKDTDKDIVTDTDEKPKYKFGVQQKMEEKHFDLTKMTHPFHINEKWLKEFLETLAKKLDTDDLNTANVNKIIDSNVDRPLQNETDTVPERIKDRPFEQSAQISNQIKLNDKSRKTELKYCNMGIPYSYSKIPTHYNDITLLKYTNECLIPNYIKNKNGTNSHIGALSKELRNCFIFSAHIHQQKQWYKFPKIHCYQTLLNKTSRFRVEDMINLWPKYGTQKDMKSITELDIELLNNEIDIERGSVDFIKLIKSIEWCIFDEDDTKQNTT